MSGTVSSLADNLALGNLPLVLAAAKKRETNVHRQGKFLDTSVDHFTCDIPWHARC
ncbi:hypothetical protein AWB83_02488 [Caballeronia ptereochthonis]|uniref:Uncharacterized protein n=1 Tax=Caballeronia ptereochthonis TaxID=1777144 RepID=A0A158AWY8_9BURK|nr:hypothetical protein AWB83_02488 [Caballeronia ptereochthonis]